jgi:RNA polymerase sigma-70 factor, ECF subfamily
MSMTVAGRRAWRTRHRGPSSAKDSGALRSFPLHLAVSVWTGRRYSRLTTGGLCPPRVACCPWLMRILDPQSLTQHVDRLYRAAWALCGSREDAEDLVQETFARVLARPRALRGEDELYYLMRVLRNTFLSGRRTASRRPVTVATLEEFDAADPRLLGQPEGALEVQEVYATIAALPEDRRLALVAVDVLGLSYREAARALRVRESTITTRLFRARQQVAKQLAPTPDSLTPASRAPASRDTPDVSVPRHSQSPAVRGNETLPTGVFSSRGTR